MQTPRCNHAGAFAFPYSGKTRIISWFSAPPFVIFNVFKQVAHDPMLPVAKAECLDPRGFEIPPDRCAITFPTLSHGLQRNVAPTNASLLAWMGRRVRALQREAHSITFPESCGSRDG